MQYQSKVRISVQIKYYKFGIFILKPKWLGLKGQLKDGIFTKCSQLVRRDSKAKALRKESEPKKKETKTKKSIKK